MFSQKFDLFTINNKILKFVSTSVEIHRLPVIHTKPEKFQVRVVGKNWGSNRSDRYFDLMFVNPLRHGVQNDCHTAYPKGLEFFDSSYLYVDKRCAGKKLIFGYLEGESHQKFSRIFFKLGHSNLNWPILFISDPLTV